MSHSRRVLVISILAALSLLGGPPEVNPLEARGASFPGVPVVNATAGWSSHVESTGTRSQVKSIDLVSEGRQLRFSLGTTGQSRRLEQVRPGALDITFSGRSIPLAGCIRVQGHVQGIGWQPVGSSAGTTGRGLQLEAIRLSSRCDSVQVQYRAHVQGVGWQRTVGDGQTAGTTGRGLRMEALEITMTFPDLSDLRTNYQDAEKRACAAFGGC